MPHPADQALDHTSGPPLLGLLPREWALVVVALSIATLPSVMPVMVGVLADQLGMGVERAGYVVSVNMGGIFAGTLACAWLSRRASWNRLLVGGLLVMVLGNGLTLLSAGYPALLATRLLSGLGEGVAGAICYALMGRSLLPVRTVAVYVAGQGIVGALGMAALPPLVAGHGWQVFYIGVSLLALPALWLAPVAVRAQASADPTGPTHTAASRSFAAWGALAAIFGFFFGLAALWAFLQPIGASRGLSVVQVSSALSASAVAGFAGSVVAGLAAGRLSTWQGTAIGLAALLASVAGLLIGTPATFFAGACLLSFAWAFEYPYLFRCLASEDDSGGIAVLTPAATGGALTAGPAIGGFVLQNAGVASLCAVGVMAAVLGSATAIALSTRRRSTGAHVQLPVSP